MYSLRVIVEELVHGQRQILTNVPIKWDVLNEYLQKWYPSKTINLRERLVKLSGSEAGSFWRHRAESGEVQEVLVNKAGQVFKPGEEPRGEKRLNEELRYSGELKSVLYVIDEVHVWFNARNWQSVGGYGFFYCSQHRGLGDDLILITQHPANVDKQFRSVAEIYVKLRNLGSQAIWGVVPPKRFLWYKYFDIPGPSTAAQGMGEFSIDKTGLADCYETQSKEGIPGVTQADKGRSAKGVPWWAAAALALGAVWAAGHFIPKGVELVVNGIRPKTEAVQKTNAPAGRRMPAAAMPAAQPTREPETNRALVVPERTAKIEPPMPKFVVDYDAHGNEKLLTGYQVKGPVIKLFYVNGWSESFVASSAVINPDSVWIVGNPTKVYRWPDVTGKGATASTRSVEAVP